MSPPLTYAYYVCPTNIKVGKHACETPTLNARRFEELVVNRIRSNILTEDSIRDLVKAVESEMGGVTREQRKRLETIDTELTDVRQRLGRLYNLVETTDMEVDDFKPRIRELRERQDRLECSAEEARAALAQRRKVLDDVNAVAAYAREMKDFLEGSELTERRAFIETFVKEILVVPGDALMRYTVPMPSDSLAPGKAPRRWPFPMPFYLPCRLVGHEVDFQEAWRRVGPVGKGAHRDVAATGQIPSPFPPADHGGPDGLEQLV